MPYQMESATCAHQQNKIDTRRLHTGRIPNSKYQPTECMFIFFLLFCRLLLLLFLLLLLSHVYCIYLNFRIPTYRRGRIPFDSTWKWMYFFLVNNVSLLKSHGKVWIQVSGLAYIHGSTARPPRWAITFVLFLVVNKAESDDIMRFCELDDVLPLLPLPVLYPLSVYYCIFMVFPFGAHIYSKWPRHRHKSEENRKQIQHHGQHHRHNRKNKRKRRRKKPTEFLIIQRKSKNYIGYSNAQHVESVLFVLSYFYDFYSFIFFCLFSFLFSFPLVIAYSLWYRASLTQLKTGTEIYAVALLSRKNPKKCLNSFPRLLQRMCHPTIKKKKRTSERARAREIRYDEKWNHDQKMMKL